MFVGVILENIQHIQVKQQKMGLYAIRFGKIRTDMGLWKYKVLKYRSQGIKYMKGIMLCSSILEVNLYNIYAGHFVSFIIMPRLILTTHCACSFVIIAHKPIIFLVSDFRNQWGGTCHTTGQSGYWRHLLGYCADLL